jgi:hypothetical protein
MKKFLATLLLVTALVSARADSVVVFNEVMYHPAANEAAFEWVELHNQMAVDVDLGGWSVRGGIDYFFPEGTVISGGGYLVVDKNIEATPVRRIGRPEDIAAACAFLISEEAGYITGQILGVNGGRNT